MTIGLAALIWLASAWTTCGIVAWMRVIFGLRWRNDAPGMDETILAFVGCALAGPFVLRQVWPD